MEITYVHSIVAEAPEWAIRSFSLTLPALSISALSISGKLVELGKHIVQPEPLYFLHRHLKDSNVSFK